MMQNMMTGMAIWWVVGILLIVVLVLVISKLIKR